MPRWRLGLRLRLALGFAAILALSTGSVALCTGYATYQEADHVQAEQDRVRARRITLALADFHRANNGWDGVQDLIDRAGFHAERDIIVLDNDGNIVGDSRDRRRRDDGREPWGDRDEHDKLKPLPPLRYFTPLVSEGVRVGSALVVGWEREGFIPTVPASATTWSCPTRNRGSLSSRTPSGVPSSWPGWCPARWVCCWSCCCPGEC